MKFYDLFCGIGGFRIGMEKNGHECVGSCEIDEQARQVYTKNFGCEPEQRDATKLNPKELPDFDCLCAGFPCQSFSIAGKHGGFEDTRGTLFFEIIRIARERKPSILFLENVKGLLSHNKGQTFETILKALDELGYWYEWQVINSKDFGVPQNRERVYIIGHLGGTSRREILPLGDGTNFNAQSRKGTQPTARHINMTKHNGSRVYSKDGIAPSVMAGEGTGTRIKIAENFDELKNTIYSIGSTQAHAAHMEDISPTLTEAMGKGGGHVPMIYGKRTKYVDGSQGMRVYGTDGASTTITAHGGGQGAKTGLYVDKGRVRRLTPLECERLQGFPDNFTNGYPDTARYRMIGNAVTTNVVQYIGGLF